MEAGSEWKVVTLWFPDHKLVRSRVPWSAHQPNILNYPCRIWVQSIAQVCDPEFKMPFPCVDTLPKKEGSANDTLEGLRLSHRSTSGSLWPLSIPFERQKCSVFTGKFYWKLLYLISFKISFKMHSFKWDVGNIRTNAIG